MSYRRFPDLALAGGALAIALVVLGFCWKGPAGWAALLGSALMIAVVCAFIAGRKGRFRNEVYGWFAVGVIAPLPAPVAVLMIRPRIVEPAT
jgi:hypothetical protein